MSSPQARQLFYLYSNWLYQAGGCTMSCGRVRLRPCSLQCTVPVHEYAHRPCVAGLQYPVGVGWRSSQHAALCAGHNADLGVYLAAAGVCISRSSGMMFQANRLVLWIMPVLQCLLLVFFSVDAVLHVWWNWWLLILCFFAGLLGGAVYVNSFTLMSREVEPSLKEFSLSAACVADSFGIAAADLTAIVIQGCLFKLQGLEGAAFSCGRSKL